METETKTWLEFPNGGKAAVEQILDEEEINPGVGQWEPQSEIMWVRSFEIEKLCNRVFQVYQLHQDK